MIELSYQKSTQSNYFQPQFEFLFRLENSMAKSHSYIFSIEALRFCGADVDLKH